MSALASVWAMGAASSARGDGCIFKLNGDYVPERAQTAHIVWNDGVQTMHLRTDASDTEERNLWIVPIPGDPSRIVAEPARTFPRLRIDSSPARAARAAAETTRGVVFWGHTGLYGLGLWMTPRTVAMAVGMAAPGAKSALEPPAGVTVHSSVERFGMVVQVVSSRSIEGFDAYLREKGFEVSASGLASLRPYLGADNGFVCGWAAGPLMEARSIRIEFPTARPFYPMRPSNVYVEPIATRIVVEGWHEPRTAGRDGDGGGGGGAYPGLTREFVRGARDSGPIVPMTVVRISSAPSSWSADLEFEPGAPAAIRVADLLAPFRSAWLWPLTLVLGLALGIPMTRWATSGRVRRPIDYVWGVAAGGALALTVAPAMCVYGLWFRDRAAAARRGRNATADASADADPEFDAIGAKSKSDHVDIPATSRPPRGFGIVVGFGLTTLALAILGAWATDFAWKSRTTVVPALAIGIGGGAVAAGLIAGLFGDRRFRTRVAVPIVGAGVATVAVGGALSWLGWRRSWNDFAWDGIAFIAFVALAAAIAMGWVWLSRLSGGRAGRLALIVLIHGALAWAICLGVESALEPFVPGSEFAWRHIPGLTD